MLEHAACITGKNLSFFSNELAPICATLSAVADSLGLNPVTDQNGVVQGIHGGPANLDPTAGTAFNPVQYGSSPVQV